MNRIRIVGVVAVAAMALSACGPSTSRSAESSSPSTSAMPSASTAKGLVPAVEGMDAVLELKERGPGELTGVVTDGKVLATVRNRPSKSAHTVSGYSVKSGKKLWSVTDEGWLECSRTSPTICQTTVYEKGKRKSTDAGILSLASGKTVNLKVGPDGKFVFAGVHADIAYFATWEGTEDIHITGFDKTGAPVADKNLNIRAPKSTTEHGVKADMSGAFVSVRAEEESGVYVAGRNGYGPLPVTGACIAVRDGAVCQVEGGVAGVGADSKEVWRIDTSVTVVPSPLVSDLSLDKAEKLLQGALSTSVGSASGQSDEHELQGSAAGGSGKATGGRTSDEATENGGSKLRPGASPSTASSSVSRPSAARPSSKSPVAKKTPSGKEPDEAGTSGELPSETPGMPSTFPLQTGSGARAGEEHYLVSLTSGPGLVKRADGGNLTLPGGAVASLGTSTLVGFDIGREPAVIDMERKTHPADGASGAAVVSSMLVGKDGKVLASLSADRANRLLSGATDGVIVRPFTFARQGDALVFYDAVDDIVGVYEEES